MDRNVLTPSHIPRRRTVKSLEVGEEERGNIEDVESLEVLDGGLDSFDFDQDRDESEAEFDLVERERFGTFHDLNEVCTDDFYARRIHVKRDD